MGPVGASPSSSPDLVPVCVGHEALAPPDVADEQDAEAVWLASRRGPSSFEKSDIDWSRLGLEPRWLGSESSDCAAALDLSTSSSHGGRELKRFLEGAARRAETAILISALGEDRSKDPFRGPGSLLILSEWNAAIGAERLPGGVKPELAPDVSGADRDLGLRLLNSRADELWWGLSLRGLTTHAGSGVEYQEPAGRLEPILLDALGNPVVAAWVPDTGEMRWYLVPDDPGWNGVLDWLVKRALPEFAPQVLRRARSPHALDPELQTGAEASARRSLEDLTADYEQARQRLEAQLAAATAAGESMRHGLLYGSGEDLEQAVQVVLEAAGFQAVRLDEQFGETTSADLLISYGDERRLVEVKAASGNAAEALVGHLTRHLATWPELRRGEPVGGGVLVLNHQHGRGPMERDREPYRRAEFVRSLTSPVLGTVQLFEWWRDGNWEAVRDAVLGHEVISRGGEDRDAVPDAGPREPASLAVGEGKSRWLRRGRVRRSTGDSG